MNRLYLYQTALLMMAVTTTMCPLATSYAGLVTYTILFGLFDGCYVALIAVITGDIVGPDKLAPALGFLYLVFSVPLMTGPLIAGKVEEWWRTLPHSFTRTHIDTSTEVCLHTHTHTHTHTHARTHAHAHTHTHTHTE